MSWKTVLHAPMLLEVSLMCILSYRHNILKRMLKTLFVNVELKGVRAYTHWNTVQ